MRPSHVLPFSLFLAALAVSSAAFATTITSGGYTATDAIPFQWDELANGYNSPITGATRVLGNHDDSATVAINLGFNFNLFSPPNGSTTQVFITSNGLLTIGNNAGATFPTPTTTSNANGPIISGTSPLSGSPAIAVAWDDWTTTPNGTDGVYYATLGTPGNLRFVVEWRGTQRYGSANPIPVSFQVVLYQDGDAGGSKPIEFRYLSMDTGNSATAFGASATVGIRDYGADTNGRYLQWSSDQGVLANNTAVRFMDTAAWLAAGGGQTVPEPGSFALLLAGLGLLGRRFSCQT